MPPGLLLSCRVGLSTRLPLASSPERLVIGFGTSGVRPRLLALTFRIHTTMIASFELEFIPMRAIPQLLTGPVHRPRI